MIWSLLKWRRVKKTSGPLHRAHLRLESLEDRLTPSANLNLFLTVPPSISNPAPVSSAPFQLIPLGQPVTNSNLAPSTPSGPGNTKNLPLGQGQAPVNDIGPPPSQIPVITGNIIIINPLGGQSTTTANVAANTPVPAPTNNIVPSSLPIVSLAATDLGSGTSGPDMLSTPMTSVEPSALSGQVS